MGRAVLRRSCDACADLIDSRLGSKCRGQEHLSAGTWMRCESSGPYKTTADRVVRTANSGEKSEPAVACGDAVP